MISMLGMEFDLWIFTLVDFGSLCVVYVHELRGQVTL